MEMTGQAKWKLGVHSGLFRVFQPRSLTIQLHMALKRRKKHGFYYFIIPTKLRHGRAALGMANPKGAQENVRTSFFRALSAKPSPELEASRC